MFFQIHLYYYKNCAKLYFLEKSFSIFLLSVRAATTLCIENSLYSCEVGLSVSGLVLVEVITIPLAPGEVFELNTGIRHLTPFAEALVTGNVFCANKVHNLKRLSETKLTANC